MAETGSQGSAAATEGERSGEWVCMDCGNQSRFQVVHYEVSFLEQEGGRRRYDVSRGRTVDEARILQMGCGSCQSVRIGRRLPGSDTVTPGPWVRRTSPETDAADGGASLEALEEVAPSLGVPEAQGPDGSLQWELENPVAGTKLLLAYNPVTAMASVYLRAGNAFIGYTALEPVTAVRTDLDSGEVEFIAGREGLSLTVTADGIFFVK